ncbi:MAG: putative transport system ATP-binding protein [Pseudonocardiales bacterium]|nr:putative transport system ATP-binding protein [Pseudonocardiales bacterium]
MIEAVDVRLEAVSLEHRSPSGVVHALDDVTLGVEPGESLAIVGPSGCGKSSLLGLVGALDAPTSGRIRVGDNEIHDMPEPQRAALRRRSFGFVFQSDNLHPCLTVVENVALQLSLAGAAHGYDRCREILDRLGLARESARFPDQLSGGQRQRVAVARALVHAPALILADEPTGALDTENSATVIDLLLGACREMGATLVMVTHDPQAAGRLDRVVALRDGRVAPSWRPARAG